MSDIWHAIADIAVGLHRDRIDAAASTIESLKSVNEFTRCISTFAPGINVALVNRLRDEWFANPTITPREVAAAMRASGMTASLALAHEQIDLVWTGPSTSLIPTRKTEQVMRELIDSATSRLFLVSYVFVNATAVVDALNGAIKRGVSVRVLLEAHSQHGGAVSVDGLSAMRAAVPLAELFTWKPADRAKTTGSMSASVHAKCAVADHKNAFVTSANLTSAAMERNMELGILVRGGSTPYRLHSHLDALVTTAVVTGHPK